MQQLSQGIASSNLPIFTQNNFLKASQWGCAISFILQIGFISDVASGCFDVKTNITDDEGASVILTRGLYNEPSATASSCTINCNQTDIPVNFRLTVVTSIITHLDAYQRVWVEYCSGVGDEKHDKRLVLRKGLTHWAIIKLFWEAKLRLLLSLFPVHPSCNLSHHPRCIQH